MGDRIQPPAAGRDDRVELDQPTTAEKLESELLLHDAIRRRAGREVL